MKENPHTTHTPTPAAYRHLGLLSRLIAAIAGGYSLAALASIAALALPMGKGEAALTGMLVSFALYAVAILWVFAARSAGRAWAGLLVAGLPLTLAAWYGAGAMT